MITVEKSIKRQAAREAKQNAKDKKTGKPTKGLSKKVYWIIGGIVAIAVGYYFYKKNKKNDIQNTNIP